MPKPLLDSIRRALARHGPTGERIDAALARIGSRPGAGETLLRVLRDGSEEDALHAALALPWADGELVRQALRRDARSATGMRRTLALAALRDEELQQVVGDTVPEDDLVRAAGPVVLNDPRTFIELVCEDRPDVTLPMVTHLERVGAAHGVAMTTLLEPVLQRRLTHAARRRVLSLLGRDPSPVARGLLEREQARARDEDDRRTVRRERLRQGTAAIEAQPPAQGRAHLFPLDAAGCIRLVVVEELAPRRTLVTDVAIAATGPVRAQAGAGERTPAHVEAATLTLGQARAFLESLPHARRKAAVPLLARLALVPPEPLAGPAPTSPADGRTVEKLLQHRVFAQWRPRVTKALARRLVAGLQHQALVLHLAGEANAGRVAAEALQVARGRTSLLVEALAGPPR